MRNFQYDVNEAIEEVQLRAQTASDLPHTSNQDSPTLHQVADDISEHRGKEALEERDSAPATTLNHAFVEQSGDFVGNRFRILLKTEGTLGENDYVVRNIDDGLIYEAKAYTLSSRSRHRKRLASRPQCVAQFREYNKDFVIYNPRYPSSPSPFQPEDFPPLVAVNPPPEPFMWRRPEVQQGHCDEHPSKRYKQAQRRRKKRTERTEILANNASRTSARSIICSNPPLASFAAMKETELIHLKQPSSQLLPGSPPKVLTSCSPDKHVHYEESLHRSSKREQDTGEKSIGDRVPMSWRRRKHPRLRDLPARSFPSSKPRVTDSHSHDSLGQGAWTEAKGKHCTKTRMSLLRDFRLSPSSSGVSALPRRHDLPIRSRLQDKAKAHRLHPELKRYLHDRFEGRFSTTLLTVDSAGCPSEMLAFRSLGTSFDLLGGSLLIHPQMMRLVIEIFTL